MCATPKTFSFSRMFCKIETRKVQQAESAHGRGDRKLRIAAPQSRIAISSFGYGMHVLNCGAGTFRLRSYLGAEDFDDLNGLWCFCCCFCFGCHDESCILGRNHKAKYDRL